jgi:transcriptional regulator with XRE-family HTH domain
LVNESVSHQAFAKYEKEEDIPRSGVLLKLSNVLNVGMDFFLQPIEVSVSSLFGFQRSHINGKAVLHV